MPRPDFITGVINVTFDHTEFKCIEWKFHRNDTFHKGKSIGSYSFLFGRSSLRFVISENNFLYLRVSKKTPFSNPITYSFSIKINDGNLIGTKTFTSRTGKTRANSLDFTEYEDLMKALEPSHSHVTVVCQLQMIRRVTENEESTIELAKDLKLEDDNSFFKGLQEMFLSGKYSDFVFNVKGREFKVHKNVLAARSPVFEAMLDHDMQENATGCVNIEDCEADIYSDFLKFLYSGEIENLNSDNVLNLYQVADKYQVTELSELCIKYMMNNFSVEKFADIMYIGLLHDVKELIDGATNFFIQNTKEITETDNWITFQAENPVVANNLFLKALDLK